MRAVKLNGEWYVVAVDVIIVAVVLFDIAKREHLIAPYNTTCRSKTC